MTDIEEVWFARSDGKNHIDVEFPHDEPEWWVKIVGMLEQNWALPVLCPNGIQILFVDDLSGVFDTMKFSGVDEARAALDWNGFSAYASDPGLKEFLLPPKLPLHEGSHPNGRIYSSGRFWKIFIPLL